MTKPPDFLSGCFYLVEFAELDRAQVVFSLGPLSADQAAIEAEELLWRQFNEAPAAGDSVRVSGPYLIDQGQCRRYILAGPMPASWRPMPGDIVRANRPIYRPLDRRG